MNMDIKTLNPDCRHFKGHVPCEPHKKYGAHCEDCPFYDPVEQKICIIKLGAIGDVIRTTPLLHRLKREYPQAEIYWLTYAPNILPKSVDHVLQLIPKDILLLQSIEFDKIINLDKDPEACALMNTLHGKEKRGYALKDGRPWPIDETAEGKFFTGLFDDVSKENSKSYQEEIFEICGYRFAGEKYMLDNFEDGYSWPIDSSRTIIGLNTGCGGRWKSRLWADENWIALAEKLTAKNFLVLLLGGPDEHEKNLVLAKKSGAKYLGHFPLEQFINLVDQCDLVVTAVTMAMHIAIGLSKKLVLFNNTFNRHEFELYGQGEILEPEFDCPCYYAPECPNNCMQYIYVDRGVEACERLLVKG